MLARSGGAGMKPDLLGPRGLMQSSSQARRRLCSTLLIWIPPLLEREESPLPTVARKVSVILGFCPGIIFNSFSSYQ